jgi:transcriptional regulator with XRE-family HTH domain
VGRSPEDIRQALGKAIRDLRAERRLTQEELAERAGVHAHYVSDIERGLRNVAIVNLTYLANAFGLTAAELLGAAGL